MGELPQDIPEPSIIPEFPVFPASRSPPAWPWQLVVLKRSSGAELILDGVRRELLQSLDFSSWNHSQELPHRGSRPNFVIQGIIH